MRIYFDYLGDNFDGYGIEDVAFDFIQFKSGDEEYVFDTTGDLDINFGKLSSQVDLKVNVIAISLLVTTIFQMKKLKRLL